MTYSIIILIKCLYFYLNYKLYDYFNYSKDRLYYEIIQYVTYLGPFFVKIGQNAATKRGIPTELKNKLHTLKYNVFYNDCINFYEIKSICKFHNISLDSNFPFAGGSICKVYSGLNKNDNQKIVIKICHEDIREKTSESITTFRNLLSFLSNYTKYASYLIQGIRLDDFYKEVKDQCDLNLEADSLLKLKKSFSTQNISKFVRLPKLYYYESDYLIESFEEGFEMDIFLKMYPKKTFETIALIYNVYIKMLLDFNIIHTDMHNSNYFFNLNEKNQVTISLIDFGMMSQVPIFLQKELKKCFSDRNGGYLVQSALVDTMRVIITENNDKQNVDKFFNKFDKDLENGKYPFYKNRKEIEEGRKTTFQKVDETQILTEVLEMLEDGLSFGLKIDGNLINICNTFFLIDEMRIKYIRGDAIHLMENKLFAKRNIDTEYKFWKYRTNYNIKHGITFKL